MAARRCRQRVPNQRSLEGMSWSIGSSWHRWDPHIHAPGTLKGNRYGHHAENAVWERYFEALRAARPTCEAIGITDYFVPRGYRLVIERGGNDKLPGVLLFPNVELRLKTRAVRGCAPNVHLLVCPDGKDHLVAISSKLAALTFTYDGERFQCTEDSLQRLGRAVSKNPNLDDEGALREGAANFLVDFDAFAALKTDRWIQENVLFGVAAGDDGLAGLKDDGAFKGMREELGRLADVIFASSLNERRYWLGEHPDAASRISGIKPCLHGSDAHDFDKVLVPDQDRRLWIRGNVTFDALRQTLVEPRRRVHIGPEPEDTRRKSNVIRSIRLLNAPWFTPTELLLNDGLVTVIGARGSGKTALADLIALAADARQHDGGSASFLHRAGDLLNNISVELEWDDGSKSPARSPDGSSDEAPRVRYLSQQFVERLSQRESAARPRQHDPWSYQESVNPADPLLDEIERVVFEAIPAEDRMGTESFTALRDVRLGDHLEVRRGDRETIRRMTEVIAAEKAKKMSIEPLKKAEEEATRARTALEEELSKLPTTAPTEHVKAHNDAVAEHKALQDAIQRHTLEAQRLHSIGVALQQEQARIDAVHLALRERYQDLLDEPTWERLRPQVPADGLADLDAKSKKAGEVARVLREHGAQEPLQGVSPPANLAGLAARVAVAQKTLGEDESKSKRRLEVAKKLDAARLAEEKARKARSSAEGAGSRIKKASEERSLAYERVLKSLEAEVTTLNELYEPLKRRLSADRELSLLTFAVTRHVDLEEWATGGERILDLRRGSVRGRGALLDAAKDILEPAWREGTPESVRAAIDEFHEQHLKDAELRQGRSMLDLGQWLYSTDHISIRYAIKYEGRDLANLSPGARGVVLLTLFLAIDQHDDRPLVIDQPEENLDPRSINRLLVPFFTEATKRRQIIMVTHNANLVVNTDADQVIVAKSERSEESELPNFTYEAGGLEEARIRQLVCQYLEGGEEAFRRRAERYGELVR